MQLAFQLQADFGFPKCKVHSSECLNLHYKLVVSKMGSSMIPFLVVSVYLDSFLSHIVDKFYIVTFPPCVSERFPVYPVRHAVQNNYHRGKSLSKPFKISHVSRSFFFNLKCVANH